MGRENNIKSNTFKYSHVLVLHRIKKEIWKRIIKLSNLAETQKLYHDKFSNQLYRKLS